MISGDNLVFYRLYYLPGTQSGISWKFPFLFLRTSVADMFEGTLEASQFWVLGQLAVFINFQNLAIFLVACGIENDCIPDKFREDILMN